MSFKFPILAADNDPGIGGADTASASSTALTRLLAGGAGEAGAYRSGDAAWASDWIWDPEAERIGARLCRKALMIWRGLSVDDAKTGAYVGPGGAIPSATLFDIGAFWSLIGYLDLLEPAGEIEGVGPDFRYRVQGTEVARAMGIDMTGRRLSDAPLAAAARDFVLASHAAVARRGRPLFARHVVEGTPEPTVWYRVLLPFLGTDGAVSRILVASRIKERVATTSIDDARGA